MFITPGLLVSGPKVEPYNFGLLSGLQSLTTPSDPRWAAGILVEDSLCANLDSTLLSCPPDDNLKSSERGMNFCGSDPFVVYSSLDCPPVDYTFERFYKIVQERYNANVERALEIIFWTGQTSSGSVNPSLAFGNPDCGLDVIDITPDAGAVSAKCAVAFLEAALAECWPGVGVLHMNKSVMTFLASENLINNEGRTITGSKIIAGSGYPGTGPANVPVADHETWIFATSQVVGFRGKPFFNPPLLKEAFDRTINNITVRLEAEWAFSFICCVFAIRMVYGVD